MEAIVIMPAITPHLFIKASQLYGSEVILVDGLIDSCAAKAAELNRNGKYFDFSTMKEPYRLEGKKTLGYEIAEQHQWSLPDVILYPTGGGTGLIGIWKAFREMLELGWIAEPLPRMIAVQSELCQPVVQAISKNKLNAVSTSSPSKAYGLNVPKPFALRLILETLEESGGDAIAVSEEELMASTKEIIQREGIMVSPEGGSLWAALKKMVASGKVQRNERVLMLNTGSGFNYLGEWS
jgi:threonine synthase